MTLPVIINIDSKYDWTKEVQDIWDTIDPKEIQQKFPLIDEEDIKFRLNHKLVIIGLCSPAFIEQRRNRDNEATINYEDENWREAQLLSNENNRRFNGEEPHFRSPIINTNFVTECYGIYTDDSSAFLSGRMDMDKLPLGANGGAGIFLCPERIIEIYPTLMMHLQKITHPISLTSNPILINLKIVLLHELGHHIFPVHRNCARRKYIPEGLANYFCYSNLQEPEKAWLLYKSRCLQPAEYSSYRFISLINRYFNTEIDTVLLNAFNGNINGWESIFNDIITPEGYTRSRFEIIERQTEHITMAIISDFIPVHCFIDDLDNLFLNERKWWRTIDRPELHMHARHLEKQIHPDFIYDLYNDNSLLKWVLSKEIPEEIWWSWSVNFNNNVGTDSQPPEELSWPEGLLFRTTKAQDWKEIIGKSSYDWARNAAFIWLLDSLENKDEISELLDDFTLSNTRHCSEVIKAFDRHSKKFNLETKIKIIRIMEQLIGLKQQNLNIHRDAMRILILLND